MKRYKTILVLYLIQLNLFEASAQNPELLKQLYSNQNQKNKLETLHELCKGYTSYAADSFIKYINWGIKISIPNSKEYINSSISKCFI